MSSVILTDFARGIAALVLVGATAWIAYLLGLHWLPRAGTAIRWCGAAVIGLWLAVATFWILTPFHAFRLAVLLPAVVLGAVLLQLASGRRFEPIQALRADLRIAYRFVASLGRLEQSLGLGVAAVAGVRFFRALASPPLGWDDLTYHLLKAGRFVQAGGFIDAPAPGAWGSYGYFPVAGEVLWSWAMLPVRSDALVAPAALLVWGLVPLGVYAGARELGAVRRPAALAALAVAAMPAALVLVSSAYVDNVTLAAVALGSVFIVRVLRTSGPEERLREAPLAIAALALAGGTKALALPLMALGGALVLLRLARSDATGRFRGAVLGACLVAGLVAAPSYARAWAEQGSPFYPLGIEILGIEVSAGNPESAAVTQRILNNSTPYSALDSLLFLLARPMPSGAFMNPGLGAAVLLLLALVSTFERDHPPVLPSLYLLSASALFLGAFLSGAMEVFRTTFMVSASGRYITPAFAALAMLAARRDAIALRILWTVAVSAGVVLSVPRGWSGAGLQAAASALLAIAMLAVGSATLHHLLRRRNALSRAAGAMAALLAVGAATAGLHSVRDAFRYPIYASAANRMDRAFQLHPLHWKHASAWPVWEALDGGRSRRIAATAGFGGLGHNWYLYPLLGSRLQNRVVYVPVTRSGEVIDYRLRREVDQRADLSCWLERLRDGRIDVVVSLAPRTTVEDRWVRELPAIFEPIAVAPEDLHAAYRVRHEELVELPLEGYCAAGPAPTAHASS